MPVAATRVGDSGNWFEPSRVKGLETSNEPVVREASSRPVAKVDAEEQTDVADTSDVQSFNADKATPPAEEYVKSNEWNTIQVNDTPQSLVSCRRKVRSLKLNAKSAGMFVCVVTAIGIGVFAIAAIRDSEGYTSAAGNRTSILSRKRKSLSTEEIVARSESSVALVKGRFSSGTGFLVDDNRLVTNKHVVEHELIRRIEIHFPSAAGGKTGPYSAELLYEDETRDLAFLRVKTELPELRIADEYAFRRGQEITVIGSPGVSDKLVLKNAISRGVMSVETEIDGQSYYQLGISINSGNSGGPVFGNDGTVIGVVTLKASKKEGLGFCIPVEQLNDSLARVEALSDDDVAKSQSMHTARVVFTYVRATGKLYKLGMEAYTDAMREAIDGGLSASDGLQIASKAVDSTLADYDEMLMKDLKSEMSKISTDSRLAESLRTKCVDFWTNYTELKSYVDEPRGSYSTYKQKFSELSDTHDRLAESLELLLGVDVSDE